MFDEQAEILIPMIRNIRMRNMNVEKGEKYGNLPGLVNGSKH